MKHNLHSINRTSQSTSTLWFAADSVQLNQAINRRRYIWM